MTQDEPMRTQDMPMSSNIEDRRGGEAPVQRTLREMLVEAFKRVTPGAKIAKDAGIDDIDKKQG